MKRIDGKDCLILFGLSTLAVGCWWILPALSLIVVGVILLIGGLR